MGSHFTKLVDYEAFQTNIEWKVLRVSVPFTIMSLSHLSSIDRAFIKKCEGQWKNNKITIFVWVFPWKEQFKTKFAYLCLDM